MANGGNKGTKIELQTSYIALIAGLQQNYQPGDVFDLPMGQMTRDQIIAEFQTFVNAAEATRSSNQAWRQDVQAERAAELAAAPVRTSVKAVLVGRYGKSSTQLLNYGIPPAKVPTVKSPAVKAAALAKSEATRAARGTKGSVQKQSITGNVTGVVITPVTAGAPVPVTAPAAGSNAASGSNGASAPPAPASPAATGGTPPHAERRQQSEAEVRR